MVARVGGETTRSRGGELKAAVFLAVLSLPPSSFDSSAGNGWNPGRPASKAVPPNLEDRREVLSAVEAKDSVADLALVKDHWSLSVLSLQSPCLAGLRLWVPSPARCKNQLSDGHLRDRSIFGETGGRMTFSRSSWGLHSEFESSLGFRSEPTVLLLALRF